MASSYSYAMLTPIGGTARLSKDLAALYRFSASGSVPEILASIA